MKILLVGNGAREHIIAERIAADAELYSVMSKNNPGISRISKKHWICDIHDPVKIIECVKSEGIDLAFASPDAVLAAGVSDALEKEGMLVASPSKNASRIEWDKGFMRNLIREYKVSGGIKHQICENEDEALKVCHEYENFVIKPLGLTGGKGVKVSGEHVNNDEEALAYIRQLLKADKKVLIEEKVEGEEFSFQAFSDGTRIAVMPPVQDHKRAFCGDFGANTGGMGSYSTGKLLPFMESKDAEQGEKILRETIHAMKKAGCPFKGVLYGQFMVTTNGVKIIEFNARFGDPEAMNVLSLFDGSLTDVLLSIAEGKLGNVEFMDKASVVKYLVPKGYPEKAVPDSPVSIDEKKLAEIGAKVYYASVYEKEAKILTTSSRAFGIVGVADNIADAEHIAEKGCSYVAGPLWHREDIGSASLIQKRIDHMKKLKEKQ
jgi:phosphoribosylamine--glycine ligase